MFAHKHFALDFGDDAIKKICEEMVAWRILQKENENTEKLSQKQKHVLARNQFNLSIILIGQRLHVDALSKRQKQKNSK